MIIGGNKMAKIRLYYIQNGKRKMRWIDPDSDFTNIYNFWGEPFYRINGRFYFK